MNPDEILALLVDLESDQVERKASLGDEDPAWEAMCAFGYDVPGTTPPGPSPIKVDGGNRISGIELPRGSLPHSLRGDASR